MNRPKDNSKDYSDQEGTQRGVQQPSSEVQQAAKQGEYETVEKHIS
jgi:hypothetical protein